MAGQGSTRVADIIVPTIFVPYVMEQTINLSALVQSGIVRPDPILDELATAGGKLINMPFFQDLSGDDEVLASGSGATDSSLTPDNVDTDKDIAALLMRGKAWGVEDLSKALSGDDPMAAIGNMVANFWNAKEQTTLIATLNGVFLDNVTNDSGDLTYDISVSSPTAASTSNYIAGDSVIDAATKLGDAAGGLTAIAMHSVPFSRLQKNNLIDFIPEAEGRVQIPFYLGKRVIVDDGCPSTAGTSSTLYDTYLFGEGAIGRGDGAAPVPVEMDRDSLAGVDLLIYRRHFILHPRGIKFTSSSVAGTSPTNAELAAHANWDRVYQKKNIRLVRLRTNG